MRKHHKSLADAGCDRIGQIYASNMWDLARRYFYEIRDFREGFAALERVCATTWTWAAYFTP